VTAFEPGDRVIIRATISKPIEPTGRHLIQLDGGGFHTYASPDAMVPAPYVEPELIPGMVVAPNDEVDARRWFVFDETRGGEFRPPHLIGFRDVLGEWSARHELPVEIRVVFDPRKATS
jgi:hypothetical protein